MVQVDPTKKRTILINWYSLLQLKSTFDKPPTRGVELQTKACEEDDEIPSHNESCCQRQENQIPFYSDYYKPDKTLYCLKLNLGPTKTKLKVKADNCDVKDSNSNPLIARRVG